MPAMRARSPADCFREFRSFAAIVIGTAFQSSVTLPKHCAEAPRDARLDWASAPDRATAVISVLVQARHEPRGNDPRRQFRAARVTHCFPSEIFRQQFD